MRPSRLAVLSVCIAALSGGVQAQQVSGGHDTMRHDHGQAAGPAKETGQSAFAAIQEIVGILQADPHTDWSKVDIDALRQHLIDMDEVTLHAVISKEPIDKGLLMAVTGSGRTLEAIRRMVLAHAHEIDGRNGWTVKARAIPDGVELTVTGGSDAETAKIRALGFMGIMVQGAHHRVHHLAIAKGEPIHEH